MNRLWKIENIGIGQCVIIARSPNRNGCPLGWGKGNLVCKVSFAAWELGVAGGGTPL